MFADGEGSLEQLVQRTTRSARLKSERVGCLDLPEDFRFAKHHGIKTTDHAEEVSCGVCMGKAIANQGLALLWCEIKMKREIIKERPQALLRGILHSMRGVNLDPIAGRKDDAFFKTRQRPNFLCGDRHLTLGKRQPLTQLDGSGAVIKAEAEDHGEGESEAAGVIWSRSKGKRAVVGNQ